VSPEDQARARLLAHYKASAERAAARLERIRLEYAGAKDPNAAQHLRAGMEKLQAAIVDLNAKAERLRNMGT
jgi:hypothetical protein